MSRYLLLVSLGPIQDFISAARKAQDLWFGSWLLSELARAVAKELESRSGVGSLVFPASVEVEGESSLAAPSVANKLLLEVDADSSRVREIAEAGRGAMAKRLGEVASPIFDHAAQVARTRFVRAVADAQVADLMEYVWVAVPCDSLEGVRSYGEVRDQAERELATVKNARTWGPVTWGGAVPKSSVDGLRESVFLEALFEENGRELRGRLHLSDAERLCGVGYLKRRGAESDAEEVSSGPLGGTRPVFHSASHVTAAALRMRALTLPEDDWGELLSAVRKYKTALTEAGFRLSDLRVHPRAAALIEAAAESEQRSPVQLPEWFSQTDSPPDLGTYPLQTQSMSAEDSCVYVGRGSPLRALSSLDNVFLYPDRLPDAFDEAGRGRKVPEEVLQRLGGVHRALGVTAESMPTYYAMVLADGDGMGAYLDELSRRPDGKELHIATSKRLVAFAEEAVKIIVSHGGSPVYTGGDDVLGFVPLPTALACSDALRRAFSECLRTDSLQPPTELQPTLSVGLAIAHHLADLNDVRRQAKEAESLAKSHPGKNALGLVVNRRSGPTIRLVGSWELPEAADGDTLHQRLDVFSGWLYCGRLSRKTAHDLREALVPFRVLENERDPELEPVVVSVLKAVLKQKARGSLSTSDLDEMVRRLQTYVLPKGDVGVGDQLARFGDELDVAWTLTKSYQSAFALRQPDGADSTTKHQGVRE